MQPEQTAGKVYVLDKEMNIHFLSHSKLDKILDKKFINRSQGLLRAISYISWQPNENKAVSMSYLFLPLRLSPSRPPNKQKKRS